jgi:hypothetical protein
MIQHAPGRLGVAPVVVYAAITGVTTALNLILGRKRGAQKRAATAIVNDLEPLLQQNLEAYLASPRTTADQAAALANFDAAWQQLVSSQYLGNPDLGEPGNRAIADRSRGGQWDWFSYYRDPIANDPAAGSTVTAVAQILTGDAQGNAALFAGAALIILGALL